MDKKDVTVIIPIYNVEKYISKCLKSIEQQDFKNFEIWAVNDGSPDNSEQIVKKFQQQDSKIKLVNKENGGYGSVLEYCVNNITSEYFLICDPDDWLPQNAIRILYDVAQNYDLDLVVGDRFHVYEKDGKTKYVKTFGDDIDIKARKVYTANIDKFAYGLVSPHAKLFRTSICRNIKFPRKVSYTDYILYMVALSRAKKVMYLDKAEAYYLIDREGNTATNTDPASISAYLKGWNSVLDQLKENDKYSGLLYRQYQQLKFILGEYANCSVDLFKDKYFDEILAAISRFRPFQHFALEEESIHISMKERIMYKLMFNKSMSLLFVKLYIRYKRK